MSLKSRMKTNGVQENNVVELPAQQFKPEQVRRDGVPSLRITDEGQCLR